MSKNDPLVFEFTKSDERALRYALNDLIVSGGERGMNAMRLLDLLDRTIEAKRRYERVSGLGDKIDDLITNLETNADALADTIGEIVIGGTLDDCGSLRADEQQKIEAAIEEKTDAAKGRVREAARDVLRQAVDLRNLYKEAINDE